MNPPFALVLGRVLIASVWADGELSPDERLALEDMLFSMPDLDADTWRALRDDLQRPFDEAHRATLLADLQNTLRDAENRIRARRCLESLRERVGEDSEEGQALTEALEVVDAASARAAGDTTDQGWMGKLRRAFGGSLVRHADRLRQTHGREQHLVAALQSRLREHWPVDEPDPDDLELRRLALGAGILAHLVRLDGVVEAGEREALVEALTEQGGLGLAAANLVADVALDETAGGVDLHVLLRDYVDATDEDTRQRFLAAVFRVAAGDGRASYDEIEEVRRIGRGLLLSHRHFIAAKLTLPGRYRET